MSTHTTPPEAEREGGAPPTTRGVPRTVLIACLLITALGGLTGLATLLSALGSGSGDGGTDGRTTATPSASVRIRYPQQAASVQHHQKVYGDAVIPPHHTLWLASHKKGEASLYLLGPVHIAAQGSGKAGPTTWDACPQVGDFPAQRGASFELVAALVPDATSDYLLGATTYEGVQLVPAKPAEAVAGLVSTRLPPGTDTAHQDSVWVTLTEGGENCTTR